MSTALIFRQSPFLNPNLVRYLVRCEVALLICLQLSELFSTLSILSSSLASGRPIPGSLPSLRDRMVYHARMSQYQVGQLGRQAKMSSSPQSIDIMDPAHVGIFDLTRDILADEQLPIHSTGMQPASLRDFYLLSEHSLQLLSPCRISLGCVQFTSDRSLSYC